MIFKEFQSNPFIQNDVFDGTLFIQIPIIIPEKVKTNLYYSLPLSTSDERSTSVTKKTQAAPTLRRIPQKFYNLNFLYAPNIPLNKDAMQIFWSSIKLNCFGVVKNLYDHKIGFPNYTLNLHNLVEFEKTVFKWIISSFYCAWIIIFDGHINSFHDHMIVEADLMNKLAHMTYYLKYFISMEFPEFCKVYLNTIKIIDNDYNFENNNISLTSYPAIKKAIII